MIAAAPLRGGEFRPQLRERLRESGEADLPFRIVRSQVRKHADTPHPLALLPARRDRPRCRRTAEQRDEVAPSS